MSDIPVPVNEVLSRIGLSYTDAGDHYKLLCPFHGDSDPSFYIRKDTSQYQCFGCGATGNWYTLVKEFTGSNPYKFLGIAQDDLGD